MGRGELLAEVEVVRDDAIGEQRAEHVRERHRAASCRDLTSR